MLYDNRLTNLRARDAPVGAGETPVVGRWSGQDEPTLAFDTVATHRAPPLLAETLASHRLPPALWYTGQGGPHFPSSVPIATCGHADEPRRRR